MITRRTLAALLPAVALAACAGQTTSQLAQTIVTDAGLVANALTNVLPNLQGVPPGVADKVASYAQQAVGAAQSLVATITQAQAQPVIQQIQTDVNAVAAAVQPYVKPGSTAAVILADIQVLMPVLLLAAGLALPAAARAGTNQDTSRARLEALPRRG